MSASVEHGHPRVGEHQVGRELRDERERTHPVLGLAGGMSRGEKRLLSIAAFLGGMTPIIPGDEVAGLDQAWTELVATAIVHAAGFTEATPGIFLEGHTPQTS